MKWRDDGVRIFRRVGALKFGPASVDFAFIH